MTDRHGFVLQQSLHYYILLLLIFGLVVQRELDNEEKNKILFTDTCCKAAHSRANN